MKLDRKKILAAKVLGVGKGRIIFNPGRLAEIADAITRQDFRDLLVSKAVIIREAKGRKAVVGGGKRGDGKIRKKVVNRKREYMTITRKLRRYVGELMKQGKMSGEVYARLRKQIKDRTFKSKAHLQSLLPKEAR